ncbi:SPFH domain-containing protein [Aromatoleum evansii]|uniref:SPFH domain-containing protein n=1 Tax=Aromatoleum evansii TaxID=59406 RepID=UPI00145D109F|nr:SPFH domain-containing protein [Aromatoleum evansii]NMG27964.1 SPFH domain-containing protein [Aromatoleum evansii]
MFGIRFIKADPTTYLMQVRGGRIVREGAGQSFFYYAPASSLVAVPVGSQLLPFIFEQTSADFQAATVQGCLSYRIADPKKIAAMLNFTLAADGRRYAAEDPEHLRGRVEGAVEVLVQQAVSRRSLRDCLQGAEAIAGEVEAALRVRGDIVALGLEILSFAVVAVRPKAETARALEAEVRETILKAADDAIYARRNAAVENERAIRESELDTEVAVELKQRTIRETRMAAEASIREREAALQAADLEARIALEGRRKEFVSLEADNTRTRAEAEAYRIAEAMKAVGSADPRIVQALASAGMAPAQLIALAFGGIAEKAERIGQLNLSPDLLQSLLGAGGAK